MTELLLFDSDDPERQPKHLQILASSLSQFQHCCLLLSLNFYEQLHLRDNFFDSRSQLAAFVVKQSVSDSQVICF